MDKSPDVIAGVLKCGLHGCEVKGLDWMLIEDAAFAKYGLPFLTFCNASQVLTTEESLGLD